ncbi:hypothetical protein F4809DRAFT_635666 [Biscogniauxia mediterranea]|nr:hypothetical protein F4809DRAFT_635666 [Biscogniauxia mediterranea]
MLFRHFSQIAAVIGTVSAAPKPAQLNYDDVILIGGDGTSAVMKEAEYAALVARDNLLQGPAPALPARSSSSSSEKNRRCDESNEIQVTSDTSFLNWDVAISPVVSAAGGGATVSIGRGYSLSNSISASAGVDVTLIENLLSMSMSLSYSETWTTEESQSFSYTVPDGQFGLVVSQPKVRRVVGNYISGCVDAPTKTAFTSDTYSSQSYGNLAWVEGVIRLCNSTTYPVPYCIGEGTHS